MFKLVTDINGEAIPEGIEAAKKLDLALVETGELGGGGGSYECEISGSRENLVKWIEEWYCEGSREDIEMCVKMIEEVK